MNNNYFFLDKLNKLSKVILLIFSDFLIINSSFFLIYYYFDYSFYLAELLITPIFLILILYIFRVYSYILKYSDNHLVFRIFLSCFLLIFFKFIFIILINDNFYFLILFFQICFIFFNLVIVRKLYKYVYIFLSKKLSSSNNLTPVYIYGAGDAGKKLTNFIKNSNNFKLMGFIDDDKNLIGRKINNKKIYSLNNFKNIANYSIFKPNVILAIPTLTKKKMILIIEELNNLGIKVQSVPQLEDILNNKIIDQIKDIRYLDYLSKDKLYLDKQKISEDIFNKSVLITGAGGSIGSNLVHQLIKYNPKNIILYELNEYSLFQIETEINEILLNKKSKINLISIIGSIENVDKLNIILKKYRVDLIYNAAALKHVNLVEKNIIEGITVNAVAPFNLLKIAIKNKVSKLIHISTDKAVNPSNVMGLTKRLAEILLNSPKSKTIVSIVRFGNVLGSRGSVYEIFENQIKNGLDVTVTHPEAKRYFMSINDATQLVIQAASLSNRNNIFALKMDDQVKILDLAKKMIELSGNTIKDDQNINGNLKIIFTGLKEGEKIVEELYENQTLLETNHKLIYQFGENLVRSETEAENFLSTLNTFIIQNDIFNSLNLIKNFLNENNFKETIIDPLYIH